MSEKRNLYPSFKAIKTENSGNYIRNARMEVNQMMLKQEFCAQSNLKSAKNYWFSALLVEDDPVVQIVHSKMLENLGCRVDVASDGYEALERLANTHDYEVIFMDIGLPSMSGIQTVEKIRQQQFNRFLPIIGLTAYILHDMQRECKTAGFNHVVTKPISQQGLKSILLDVATQGSDYQIL